MRRTRLADRLDVTAIGLGTAPLGGLFAPVSDADAEATIECAWSLGVRFFDTAPLYGFGCASAVAAEAELMQRQCLKRKLVPDDVARVALFLAADQASAITAQSYIVDGGWV